MDKINTFIYGSCVSRDTYEMVGKERGLNLIQSVARQSLVSAFHPTVPTLWNMKRIPSAYQRRNTLRDIESSLPPLLKSSKEDIDLLVIDLIDERSGFWQLPDGGVFTPLQANRKAAKKPYSEFPGKRFSLNSPHYHSHFKKAAEQLKDLLISLGLFHRCIVIDIPLSTQIHPLQEGQDLEAELSCIQDAKSSGPAIIKCYQILEELGFNMAGCQSHKPLMVHDHIWGLAPFHFDNETYQLIANKLLAFSTSSTCEN